MNSVVSMFEQDPMSRHEAGEGWAAHGLDEELLLAIALRETLRIQALAAPEAARPGIRTDLVLVASRVEQIKYEHNIPHPPSA